MTEHQSSRTLLKSAPELWAECSDAASLARHLGWFGEIRITKLEPETTVAWEGAAASGTVSLASSGWGTRVTLTVKHERRAPEPVAEQPEPVAEEPEPVAEEPEPVVVEPEPVVVEPEPVVVEPEPEPVDLEPPPEPVEADPARIMAEPERPPGRLARFRLAFRRRPAPAVEPAVPASEPEPASLALGEPELLEREPVEPEPVEPAPVAIEPEPEPVAEAPGAPDPAPATGEEALVAALDSLGMAHHRPYSRA